MTLSKDFNDYIKKQLEYHKQIEEQEKLTIKEESKEWKEYTKQQDIYNEKLQKRLGNEVYKIR
jgi:hypothetical protein